MQPRVALALGFDRLAHRVRPAFLNGHELEFEVREMFLCPRKLARRHEGALITPYLRKEIKRNRERHGLRGPHFSAKFVVVWLPPCTTATSVARNGCAAVALSSSERPY
jgi:hypothetical protein